MCAVRSMWAAPSIPSSTLTLTALVHNRAGGCKWFKTWDFRRASSREAEYASALVAPS